MTDSEKVRWLSVLASMLGIHLFVYVAISLSPGRNTAEAYAVLPWVFGSIILGYLLVLSWRGAYLAGRKS